MMRTSSLKPVRTWAALTLAITALLSGAGCVDAEKRNGDYALKVEGIVRDRLGDPSARVAVAGVDVPMRAACGWFTVGASREARAFNVWEAQHGLVVRIQQPLPSDPAERAVALFDRALIKRTCNLRQMPPVPAGLEAGIDPKSERALDSLWDTGGPSWAIIDATGKGQYLAVARRLGGGVIVSPTFTSAEPVQAWIDGEGNSLSAKENREGQEAMARFDACLDQRKVEKTKNCREPGMDKTVIARPRSAGEAAPS